MKSEYKKFPKSDIENWTPEINPDPSYDFMIELYLEYVNDYLTIRHWAEAHHMDTITGQRFIELSSSIWRARSELRDVLKAAKNPHA